MEQKLVSILIPTHNRLDLFKIAFQSVMNQTYKNLEIVISDDSDNDETYQYMQAYLHDDRIHYKWNKGFDAYQNWMYLIKNCHGEYFNFLMDDDAFAPEKIEKMVAVYEQYPNVSLVTSHRQMIDINGNKIQDVAVTKPIVDKSSVISGEIIAREILRTNMNFIGEPTTVLIKDKYRWIMAEKIQLRSPLIDVMTWLELCKQGDVAYITDTLSYFRYHDNNDQNRPVIRFEGWRDWNRLYYKAYQKEKDLEKKDSWLKRYVSIMSMMIDMWIRISPKGNQNHEERTRSQQCLDEVIAVYLSELKGKKDWQATPSIQRFIEEYEAVSHNKVQVGQDRVGMKAVILAGGYGTRITEESRFKPKPMVEIGGMPILWHIMKEYSAYGINDFIICAGYKQEIIKEWFNNYFLYTNDVTFHFKENNRVEFHRKSTEPWTVTIVDTGEDTMTGGRIKRIEPYIHEENFLMTYGDAVCDVNIGELIDFHLKSGKVATLTTVMQEQSKGIVNISVDNSVRSFREKSNRDKVSINAGYMVLNKKIFDYIYGDMCVFEKGPLEQLAKEGQLMSYMHKGYWQCMDTLFEKQNLDEVWKSGKAPWKIW